MEKKVAHKASSFTPAPAPADAASKAAKAPTVGMDTNKSLGLSLPDTMTKTPKLPTTLHPGVPANHVHNTARHTERFGTETERSKHRSDMQSNYGCTDGDAHSY